MPENTYGARSVASSQGVTPSSVAVLRGLDGSGGVVSWSSFVGLHSGLETLIGGIVGVRLLCPVPMLAPLPVSLCHLNGLFIRRWCPWIWLTDPLSTFSLYFVPWALVSVPALTLDSFLSLLSTLNLPLSDWSDDWTSTWFSAW